MSKWNGLNRNKPPRFTRPKTLRRNKEWHRICMERAKYLIDKYGVIICEYSGETIRCLSSVPNDIDDGWGHHIDSNRNNCVESNCMITKYRYHRLIHDNNLEVTQEWFLSNAK